jgi:hypothetical protein
VVPRSFKVPRRLNPRADRSGPSAMAKAYRKYGWGLIGSKAKNGTNGNGTKESGQVAANPEQNAALFLSPVNIGGQTLNLDFDTGSSDLWVFSTELSQATIGGHTAFNPKNSSSFKAMNGATFLITYGDGSGAAGNVGTETVDIGGATVTEQAVELATAVSQSFVQDTNTDGLVGLAFSKLNTIKVNNQAKPQKTFFDNIMPDLDLPVFTADLTNDTTGTYEFGKIDNSKFKGQLTWTPVDNSNGFWQVKSEKFTIDGKVQQAQNANPAIADTGTSLLLVDDAVAKSFYSQVPGAQLSEQLGGFVYPCNAKVPSFGVAIGDNYIAEVPGDQITFAQVDNAGTTCFGGVQSNGGANLQIYGDTMFKTQFVVFNGQNNSIAFAPKN